MPLYEYQCKECKRESEVLVRGSEQPECPACGSKKMEKLLSVTAAPNMHGSSLPTTSAPPTCGRPQCGSGCMFE
ncbi:MAG: zinc ribbon domain-containing protein [Pirellulaceae bacterium]|nr:zinc ribbon domain-containing protein [Pirellulaceae bacterium]